MTKLVVGRAALCSETIRLSEVYVVTALLILPFRWLQTLRAMPLHGIVPLAVVGICSLPSKELEQQYVLCIQDHSHLYVAG